MIHLYLSFLLEQQLSLNIYIYVCVCVCVYLNNNERRGKINDDEFFGADRVRKVEFLS